MNPDSLKIVFVGEKNVGKRTLLRSIGAPARSSGLYIPVEYVVGQVQTSKGRRDVIAYDSLYTKNQVRDNQPQVKALDLNYTALNGASAVVLVFAQNDRRSFDSLKEWAVEVGNQVPLFIVANKADLNNQSVGEEELQEFSNSKGALQYFNVTGTNRNEAQYVLEAICDNEVVSGKTLRSAQTGTKGTDYYSPTKLYSKIEVRRTDQNEKVVLNEGSYVKKMTVSSAQKESSDKYSRLQQKGGQAKYDDEPQPEDF